MAKRSRSKGKVVTLDFSGVEGREVIPIGEYDFEVTSCEEKEGSNYPYFEFKFKIMDGDEEGKTLYHNASLAPQSLWSLKDLLEALDLELPDEAFDLDLEELVGLSMSGEVEHEDYNGKDQARLANCWPLEVEGAEDEPEEEEEEEKPKKSRSRKSKKEEPEDEDESDEDESDSGEDEEEEEKPKKKSRKSSKKTTKKKKKDTVTSDEIDDMNQEDLEEFMEENDLEVDFAGCRTLKKKRAAVLEVAEEADLIDDE